MGIISKFITKGLLKRYLKSKITKISQSEFDNLYEYSCSVPTGTIIGKRWKRQNDYYDKSKGWLIGEYIDIGSENEVGIQWTIPEII